MIITPVTELDAVNEILSAVGSSPVSTIEGDLNVEVINARRILDAVSYEIQARGWDFNTEESVVLKPDLEKGYVPCPPEFLRYFAEGYKLIQRDGYFYDTLLQSDVFEGGLTLDTLVRKLEFQELPPIFKKYITARAARIYQARFLGSAEVDQSLSIAESEAYADIVDYELTSGSYNIYEDDTTISQNIQRS